MSKHIAIIGNGIAGVTCARHLRKRDSKCKITLISGETEHFFSRTALMYIYMGHMKYEHTKPYEDWFWVKNRIDLVFNYVVQVDTANNQLYFKDNAKLQYDELVLATGSKPNKFGWKGQDLAGVGGLFSYQDLQYMEKHTAGINTAVIIGGGLIGVEMAEMLVSRGVEVHFLIREKIFWGNVLPEQEAKLIMRHLKDHGVNLLLETELNEIIGDEQGKVKAIKTSNGDVLACEWVGLTAGVQPNIDFLKTSNLELNKGILVDDLFKTNVPNVHAIGDCAEFKTPIAGRRAIEQVWYTGKIMGETLAKTLTGSPTSYNPGNWFNSAKFFDIEYQTYGWVFPNLKETEKEFYWENTKENLAMHFVFDNATKEFKGINTFGIRLRHEAFNHWLNKKTSIYEIMEHLSDANFDPEFYKRYEKDILQQFNDLEGTQLKSKKKNWARILTYKFSASK